jgi:mannose-1-phosphate guanylyltransferase
VLDALARHEPAIGKLLDPLAAALASGEPGQLGEVYSRMPSISFDRAVLERADNVLMVPALFRWDDLGSWSALARVLPADRDGNLILAPAVSAGASGCLVDTGGKPVALLGVKDLIIVDAGDVLLVADRRRDQEIREVREMMKKAGMGHLL